MGKEKHKRTPFNSVLADYDFGYMTIPEILVHVPFEYLS